MLLEMLAEFWHKVGGDKLQTFLLIILLMRKLGMMLFLQRMSFHLKYPIRGNGFDLELFQPTQKPKKKSMLKTQILRYGDLTLKTLKKAVVFSAKKLFLKEKQLGIKRYFSVEISYIANSARICSRFLSQMMMVSAHQRLCRLRCMAELILNIQCFTCNLHTWTIT